MKVFGRLKKMLAVGLVCVFTMVSGAKVFAADVPDYRIQISPVRFDLELNPGKTVRKDFIVQNTGSKSFRFELNVTPYSVTGEEYSQDLSKETNYTDIVKWVTFSQKDGNLEPNENVKITATVKVPNDVPEGGQYAAILARMIPDNPAGETSGVNVYNEVGLLVYSKNVDGKTREEGKVVENKVPSFMFAPPISATSIVENTGNVHADATYVLQVYPLFGDEEVYTNEEHPESRTILPETRRLNTLTWDGAPQLGIFRVKQTVKFLGQASVTEKVVFICPLWFLFIVLAIIFLAVFWIVSRVRSRRKED